MSEMHGKAADVSAEDLKRHVLKIHGTNEDEFGEWADEGLEIAPKVEYDEPEALGDWGDEEKYDYLKEKGPVSCFEAKEALEKLKKFLQQSEIGENCDIGTMTMSDLTAYVRARTTISSLKKTFKRDV